jgi:hypothetical protein
MTHSTNHFVLLCTYVRKGGRAGDEPMPIVPGTGSTGTTVRLQGDRYSLPPPIGSIPDPASDSSTSSTLHTHSHLHTGRSQFTLMVHKPP